MGTVFKEPEGERRAWVFVLKAGYFLLESIFFRESVFDRLVYLTFGAAVLEFGLSEFMSRDRAWLAGTLRIGASS